jgi:hypothetical protein
MASKTRSEHRNTEMNNTELTAAELDQVCGGGWPSMAIADQFLAGNAGAFQAALDGAANSLTSGSSLTNFRIKPF